MYIWKWKRYKKTGLVHLKNEKTGKSWCKAENGGVQFDAEGERAPHKKFNVCKVCLKQLDEAMGNKKEDDSPFLDNGPKTFDDDPLPVHTTKRALRDEFAMAALPACVGNHEHSHEYVAEEAYLYADAMMEARK